MLDYFLKNQDVILLYKEEKCPLCGNELNIVDLSIIETFCDKCGAGFDQNSDTKTPFKRYKSLTSLNFRIDFLFIELGGVFVIDIIATFLITFRFLTAGILGRIPLYGWLFQILGIRLLIYVLIERSALGALYGLLQSTIDAFTGFIFLIFFQDLYLQTIMSENYAFLFILLISIISSWLSIIFLLSRISNFKKTNSQRKTIFLQLQKKFE